MIRSSSLTLQLATNKKLNILNTIFDEYAKIVNIFIEKYKQSNPLPKFSPVKIDTWLSVRLQQCAGKQALEIIRSTRKKDKQIRYNRYRRVYKYFKNKNRQLDFLSKKYTELNLKYKITPNFNGKVMDLDNRFWTLSRSTKTFDFWLKLTSIGNKIKLLIPINDHKHNKKFNNWKQISSCRLTRNKEKFYITFIYEKETPSIVKPKRELAIDAGINCLMSCSDNKQIGLELKQLLLELNNKIQCSKAYYRKLNQIHNYVRWCTNQLDFEALSDIIIEDLKYIQIGTKQQKRANKTTRKLLSKWNLGLWHLALQLKCEENSVYLHLVEPRNTSRTCPKCGNIDKGNRKSEKFKCKNCGYEANADLNAALNILDRFHQEKFERIDVVPDTTRN